MDIIFLTSVQSPSGALAVRSSRLITVNGVLLNADTRFPASPAGSLVSVSLGAVFEHVTWCSQPFGKLREVKQCIGAAFEHVSAICNVPQRIPVAVGIIYKWCVCTMISEHTAIAVRLNPYCVRSSCSISVRESGAARSRILRCSVAPVNNLTVTASVPVRSEAIGERVTKYPGLHNKLEVRPKTGAHRIQRIRYCRHRYLHS